MDKPRIRVPATARKGEIVEIKTLIRHPMESGQRKDASGALLPRKIINRFVVAANGRTILDAALYPAMAVDPFIVFKARIDADTKFEMTWYEDGGASVSESAEVKLA
ncbi:thiosulfate oxidation carrier complex protein SoxZ [Azospirillum halopraeferens]|uniref:thiosulfate oxidation carrier complex protein SoxZ n=1 Tax=Azospirillum halopraeferens TaxID=34010 RepID=UPI000413EA62|nr:thiosulfate oxidation carrier complex protein SoxZ [Azospirillum halopraeferens]